MAHFGDYQNEIYGAGLAGIRPDLPVDFASLEARASAALPPPLLDYVRGGCGDEHTQRTNATAFAKLGLVPRMLIDGTTRSMATSLFGFDWAAPVFLSPIGVIGICAQDGHGDRATARACRATGIPFTISTLASDPMEQVAGDLGTQPGLFQLYTPRHQGVAESLIHRAEQAGMRALVVTLDTWLTGWRPRDLNTSSFPQLRGHALENYFSDPVFRSTLARPPEEDRRAATMAWAAMFGRCLTWDDFAWLRGATKLPLVLKGICHPDDAKRAIDLGADAIYVSNHGGRQANGGIPCIDHLAPVAEAVARTGSGRHPILFDSGIRSGTDIVKALARGADAVGIGRPYAYALALGGEAGVAHLIRSFLAEADLLMAVDGYPTLASLRDAPLTPV